MQARAPDEGPSGGWQSSSETAGYGVQLTPHDLNIKSEDLEIEERYDLVLRAVVTKHNIDSTRSLVAAYNKTTDKDERTILLGWLRKYHEQGEDCLTSEAVLEYSELANIDPGCMSEEIIIRHLICDICSCISVEEFLSPNVAAALCKALTRVDPSTYGGVEQLVIMARKLLGSLSATPSLQRENFSVHRGTFLALQQTLFLLCESNQNGINKKEKQELRQAIEEKERVLEQSCKYYPVTLHFQAFRQAVERIKARDTSIIAKAAYYITRGFCGFCEFAHVSCFLRMLTGSGTDPVAIDDAYKRRRAVVVDIKVAKRPWFDAFRNLLAARLEAAKDETKLTLFGSVCSITIENAQKMEDSEGLKALRYGIIHELGILAIEGSSESTRREATMRLSDLAMQQGVSEGWIDDEDILIAILDSIHEAHKTGQCNEKIKEALTALHRCCEGSTRDAMMAWLDGESMEDKLRARYPPAAQLERKDLFIRTGRDVGHKPIREDLRKTYLHDNFATVALSFDEGSPTHVMDMKHHVVISEEIIEEQETISRDRPDGDIQRVEEGKGESSKHGKDQGKDDCEKRTTVRKPIALDDLFKGRSLRSGDSESEIRRVLLYGNPGSGKTCIAKVIAHRWALGEMAQDIEAVYVVPVSLLNSVLRNEQKCTSLEEALSQICLSGCKRAFNYEDLVSQVGRDLDDPSTLLMVDGLDEASDDAIELLSIMWERSCRIFILSRPYNTRNVETHVDIQIECLGFDDRQLRDYIKSKLSKDEAVRRIRFIENSNALWEIAHIPVMANVLCSLSKEHGTSSEERGKRASMFQIYSDMTNAVWKRFEQKPTARNIHQLECLQDLEKIAFESICNGEGLIQERFVEKHATAKNASRTFKESGFLLPVVDVRKYQFLHLTFREYYAGRYIAKNLRRKESDRQRVEKFIQERKYSQKHASTLSFAMHALAREQNKFALHEMLSLIDAEPIAVLGIQHFLLKMRVLEATVEEIHEDDLDELLNDKQAKIVEGARQLLQCTIDDVHNREIVVQQFQRLSCVLKNFPRVFNDIIEEAKKTLACVHDLSQIETAKMTDVLKLTKNSPEISDAIIQFVMEKFENPDGWCNPKECIKRLSSVAQQLPHGSNKRVPTLVKWSLDRDSDVCRAAMAAINSIVTAAPENAGEEVLSTLVRGCVDKDSDVRLAAMEAIGRVLVATPQHAGEVLTKLVKWCVDKDSDVRLAAMEAIGRVLVATPQHAGEVLSTLVRGCVDKDSDVRLAAMEAIGRVVVAAPQHTGEVLTKLVKWCVDKDSDVRLAAMEAIGRVVTAAPQHAGEVLTKLVEWCAAWDPHVRRAAIEAIGSVIAAAPQHGGEVLTKLVERFNDRYIVIHRAAMEAIGRVLVATPQHAKEVLPELVKKCADWDPYVRRAAIEAIDSVIAAAPQHGGEVLATLANCCVDTFWRFRLGEMEVIGRVVATAPRHAEEVLPKLVKRCTDWDWYVRRAAIEAIGRVVSAAPQHAKEVLPKLVKKCADWDPYVRRAAIEAIGSVIAAAPQHGGRSLPKLVKSCVDKYTEIRREAMAAIGSVIAAAPQHAGKVIPILAKWCVDGDSDMRRATIVAIGTVVAAAPQHAGEVVPMLAKGCVDVDSHVRQATSAAIDSFVAAAPQHAGEVVPKLVMWCVDNDWRVRGAGMAAIGSIVAAAPQHTSDVLPKLAEGCIDKDSDVRRAAIAAIGRVIEAAPQHAGRVVSTLAKGCVDGNSHVRRATLVAIDSFVAAAPQYAGEVLPKLVMWCVDNDWRVRGAGMAAIGSIVAAAPQHTSDVLPKLAEGCIDKDSDVRRAAIAAIGSVVAAAPQYADESMPFLLNGRLDRDWEVRQSALAAIGSVVVAAPRRADEVLLKLDDGCVDGNSDVRQAMMVAIGKVVETPQHAGEVMPTLVKWCVDGDFDVRQAATAAIGSVIAAAPQHAGGVLPALVKLCIDRDFNNWRAAIEAIAESVVAKSPHILTELLQSLEKEYKDEDFLVRQNAIMVVDEAFGAKQHLACQLIPMLERGCKDKDFFVRQNAIEVVCKVIIAAPDLAGEVLILLDEGCTDEVYFVRFSAIEVVSKVLRAVPQLVDKLLPMLSKGLLDEDFFVRAKAIEAAGLAIKAAPQLATELLPLFERECIDEHIDVRSNALKAIEIAANNVGNLVPMLETVCIDEQSDVHSNALKAIKSIVQTALRFTRELLPALQERCDDEYYSVYRKPNTTPSALTIDPIPPLSRIMYLLDNFLLIHIQNPFTLKPPTEDKKVPFVLHTITSHEIGRWDRQSLDKYFTHLKLRFEEKFPGLLEKLVTKE